MAKRALFCEADGEFFRGIAADLAGFSGTTAGEEQPDGSVKYSTNIYQLDKSANINPWLQEIDSTLPPIFRGPFNVPVPVTDFEEAEGHYSQNPEESGVEREYDAIAWFDFNNWQEEVLGHQNPGFKEPGEGDIVSLFEETEGNERWFEVIRVERFGYVVSSDKFTGWKVSLINRSSMDASRRLNKQNT